ncbi:chorismate mutase [Neisseriaceae bacterium JH1-16]|nr:chorismate mutase [Neisseriaceae bacterium JH1-16]
MTRSIVVLGIALAAQQVLAAEPLEALVDAVAQRLAVADQVALAKWDGGKAVEDRPREQQVIAGAVAQSVATGLEGDRVARFFADQIEANKLVQYALLADWRRAGAAPAMPRASLVSEIRPRLDRLQGLLLQLLAASSVQRRQQDCSVRLAKLAGNYAQRHGNDAVHAIALDRALASVCEQ